MADESYYWYKSHGICVKCKKNNASPNRIMCDECREKWNAIRRERNKNPEYKNWKKQYNKEHKEKMLENGLCPMCGKPLYQGHKTCYEHWLKNRKRWKRYEENHRGTIRSQWREAGLCLNCGKQRKAGSSFCEYHQAMMEKSLEKARKAGGWTSDYAHKKYFTKRHPD